MAITKGKSKAQRDDNIQRKILSTMGRITRRKVKAQQNGKNEKQILCTT
jgi:hypothetical protein